MSNRQANQLTSLAISLVGDLSGDLCALLGSNPGTGDFLDGVSLCKLATNRLNDLEGLQAAQSKYNGLVNQLTWLAIRWDNDLRGADSSLNSDQTGLS